MCVYVSMYENPLTLNSDNEELTSTLYRQWTKFVSLTKRDLKMYSVRARKK